jgi:hypothetical protein
MPKMLWHSSGNALCFKRDAIGSLAHAESSGTLPYLSSIASAHARRILFDANADSAHAAV